MYIVNKQIWHLPFVTSKLSCLHTTRASLLSQASSQMVPQRPLKQTSTLPSKFSLTPARRTSPLLHSALSTKRQGNHQFMLSQLIVSKYICFGFCLLIHKCTFTALHVLSVHVCLNLYLKPCLPLNKHLQLYVHFSLTNCVCVHVCACTCIST